MGVWITGDCHGDFKRFGNNHFKEAKEGDIVIILGDFGGVWDVIPSNEEIYWLNWLNEKPFTTLFVDGNHENFDRLNTYPVVDLFGGKAHKIKDKIYHLIRGNIYEIEGKKFFAFGGASSHDIDDGILDPKAYMNIEDFKNIYHSWAKQGKMFRVRGFSWWDEELPTDEELVFAERTLEENNYEVDYVISHCCPQEIASLHSNGLYKSDKLTLWFNDIAQKLKFNHWYFGHYHEEADYYSKFHMRYYRIERIL